MNIENDTVIRDKPIDTDIEELEPKTAPSSDAGFLD